MAKYKTSNGHTRRAYSPAQTVAAAAADQSILRLDVPHDCDGIKIGLGVSPVAAWASPGITFALHVNGKFEQSIEDEIADLIQRDFFPMNLAAGDNVELFASNAGATDAIVAAVMSTAFEGAA